MAVLGISVPPPSSEPVPGALTEPSEESAGEVAAKFLAGIDGASDVEVVGSRSFMDGSVVQLDRRFGGLRVVGSRAVVRVDARGRVRSMSSGPQDLPPDLSTTPSIAPTAAVNLALDTGRYRGLRVVDQPELVVLTITPFGPRLAYEVIVVGTLTRPSSYRAYVDAHTGRILRRVPLVHSAKAAVFAENPRTTPTLVEVELPELQGNGDRLLSEDLRAGTCVGVNSCEGYDICNMESLAAPTNGDGDYRLEVPDPTDPADPFAEVMVFHHTSFAYAVMRELSGFDALEQRPLTLVTNLQTAAEPIDCEDETFLSTEDRIPMENAYFGEVIINGEVEAVLAYGQGQNIDWSYDADIIYHEFGHAFVAELAPELGGGFLDELGWNSTPSGLHEAYADMIAVAVTDAANGDADDDGKIAEYVASEWGDSSLRDLAQTHRCPSSLDGEPHSDGLPFTSALWQVRKELGSQQRPRFDKAMLTALATLGAQSDINTATTRTFEAIAAEWEDATTVTNRMAAAFRARGLIECGDVAGACPKIRAQCASRTVVANDGVAYMALTGTDSVDVVPAVPGPLQFSVELDEAAVGIRVELDHLGFWGEQADVHVLVKVGEAPIKWEYDSDDGVPVAQSDHDLEALMEYTEGPDGVVSASAIIHCETETGQCSGGRYQVMFAIAGASLEAYGVNIGPADASDAKNDVAQDPSDGVSGEGQEGCGCSTSQGPRSAWLMPVIFGLLGLRRRAMSPAVRA